MAKYPKFGFCPNLWDKIPTLIRQKKKRPRVWTLDTLLAIALMPLYDTYDTKGRTGLKLRIYIWRRMRFRKTQYLFYPPRIKVSILLQEIREGRKERKVRKSLVGRPGTNIPKSCFKKYEREQRGRVSRPGHKQTDGERRTTGRREKRGQFSFNQVLEEIYISQTLTFC